jgi:pentatricopeptide repeat domain-containing protein 1
MVWILLKSQVICLLKKLNGENTSSDLYYCELCMSYLHQNIIGYCHYRFKRLTGRNEVAISARDYKFYCPRRKHRRLQNSVSSINGLPTFPGIDSSTLANTQGFREDQSQQQHTPSPSKHHMSSLSHQFHQSIHQSHQHHQSIYQSQHAATHYPSQNHQCDPELSHTQMACLQPLTGGHVMPNSPAKFCDQCGAQYLRETSKFCSECGSKRLGI